MTTPVRIGRFALGSVLVVLALIGLVESTAVALSVGFVVAVAVAMGAFAAGDRPNRSKPTPAALLRCGAIGLISVPVLAGLVAVLGPVSVPVLLLCLAGFGWYRWRRPAPPDVVEPVVEDGDDLAGLSDPQLAREWRRSHALLRRAATRTELSRLCVLRRRQLDEMERRDPAGFHRWISSGGWVTGDSAPFLGA